MIRKARMEDVKQIHALLKYYADKRLLLGRSISSLYDHLRDFIVFDENGGPAFAGPPRDPSEVGVVNGRLSALFHSSFLASR